MNSAVNELARSVVDKNSIHECTINELEELTRQYPYFGPAQFLLAEKLKQENSPRYEQQSQKAILFFQDHLWFDYLSRKDDVTATITATTFHEPATTDQQIVSESITIIKEEPDPVELEQELEAQREQAKKEMPEVEEPAVVQEEEPLTGEIHVAPEPETIHTQEEEKQPEEQQPEPEPEVQQAEVQPEPVTDIQPEEDDDTEAEPAPSDNEPPIRLPSFKIEPVDLNKPLSFEPYHTVDYFASQGILLKEDDKPKDKFGRQLKSFTEWLKSMKKLPESEVAIPPAAPEDQRVTKMAEHSITDSQVVTEAMADVWEKQGNKEKAIETWHKLSLLNPAKSAYFAAKIEHLKRQ